MVYRLNVKEKQKNDHNRTFLFSYLLAHSLDRSIGFVDDFFFSMHSKKCFLWRSKQKNRSHTKMLPAIDLLGIRRCDQRFNFQVYSWKSDEIGFLFFTGWVNLTQWICAIWDERKKNRRIFVPFVVQACYWLANIFQKVASVFVETMFWKKKK